jgi:predicted DNA-binding ribbon-helix-helix protein
MKTIKRVQTGVRIEGHLLKVLKVLAEYLDLTLGDLLEGIVLHSF